MSDSDSLKAPETESLRRYTPARVSLGRVGAALPTKALLDFQLDHARARDAVHAALDVSTLLDALVGRGLSPIGLHSAAATRDEYLRRPDLGRRLHPESAARLAALRQTRDAARQSLPEVVFVLADGLSALAVQHHALPLLDALLPRLQAEASADILVCVVEQGRVAVGDIVGEALGARFVIVLLGERPGLSSPDSLGAYITWQPRRGRTDAERNCISNIRTGGLESAEAAERIHSLLEEARSRQLTGVALKQGAALASLPEEEVPSLPQRHSKPLSS